MDFAENITISPGGDVMDLVENITLDPVTICLRREEGSLDVIDFAENILMSPVIICLRREEESQTRFCRQCSENSSPSRRREPGESAGSAVMVSLRREEGGRGSCRQCSDS
jgi:hypothetical protein